MVTGQGKPTNTLRLGSRGSRLALWQAEHVKALLEAAEPGLHVHIEVLQTTGDRILDVPLAMIGDKGLFTKEVDNAVLSGQVDLAVHSLKDVPTRLPDGLVLGAVMEREDPRDVFLPAPGRPRTLGALPAGARVGTSSLRRRAQLLHHRPDLVVEDLRGNLDTRFARLIDGHYDAAILAFAGVHRLGRADAVGEILGPPDWLPAAGQGALGVAVRADDPRTRERILRLDDPVTRAATSAERTFLRELEGGCQIPIGALATPDGSRLVLDGLVADLDGVELLRDQASGTIEQPERLGLDLAHELIRRGADRILRRVRDAAPLHLPRASAP